MLELFKFSFSFVNLIPTILLLLVAIYWVTVLFGLFTTHSFDFDINHDVDIDVDVDVDVNVDADIDIDVDTDVDIAHADTGSALVAPNFFIKSLLFFNIGKIPFMIFLSALVIPFWASSIIINYYLHIESTLISLLLLIPILFANLFIAKLITQPIARMFKKMDAATGEPEKFAGKIAKVRITLNENSNGQIELKRDGATAILSARSTKGKIKAGQSVLIIDYIKEKKYYIVEEYDDI